MGTLSCWICGAVVPPYSTTSCRSCGSFYSHSVEVLTNGVVDYPTTSKRDADWAHEEGNRSPRSGCSLSLEGTIFSPESLKAAEKAVQQRLLSLSSVTGKTAGKTEVDNRVVEETFCESCGKHTLCRSFARQTRSADEGQTIFFQCTECKSEWQQNS